jgi:tetrapyrrole methylase family protein/MazG family protein
MVNLARWLGVEPEDALRRMVDRFMERFAMMERLSPKPLKDLSLKEWDELWEKAKGVSSS